MERILWQPWTAVARQRQVASGVDKLTTYRKGTKWLRPELVGQRVEFFDQGTSRVFATARVISVKAAQFKDLDQIDHDRQSSDMTPEDRLGVMQSVYEDFDENSLTTVVTLGDVQES